MTDSAPQPVKQEDVIGVLKYVYDPELQMDIVNLGLIYEVDVKDGGAVVVKMTLTSPGCPYGPALIAQAKDTVLALRGVTSADIELVYTPPWGPERMSEEAKLELGFDL